MIPSQITSSSPESTPTLAFIGLGGNVGDSAAVLRAAVHRLMTVPRSRFLRVSRFYSTPAWGQRDQADFVNAVVALETVLPPQALLDELLGIERDFGRIRDAERGRWGPRTLDLDLIFYGGEIIDTPPLVVPHPRFRERLFVLVPLAEVAAGWIDPVTGRSVGELRDRARQAIETKT